MEFAASVGWGSILVAAALVLFVTWRTFRADDRTDAD